MDLAQLIAHHRAGRTYRQLEHACGGNLTQQRWQQLATRTPRAFPTVETIIAISVALDLPERTVLLAAGESLGLRTDIKPRLCDLIPETADRLPAAAVAAIVACITAMLDLYKGMML